MFLMNARFVGTEPTFKNVNSKNEDDAEFSIDHTHGNTPTAMQPMTQSNQALCLDQQRTKKKRPFPAHMGVHFSCLGKSQRTLKTEIIRFRRSIQ